MHYSAQRRITQSHNSHTLDNPRDRPLSGGRRPLEAGLLADANRARLDRLTACDGRLHPSVVGNRTDSPKTEARALVRFDRGRFLLPSEETRESCLAGHLSQSVAQEFDRHRGAPLIHPADFVAGLYPQVSWRHMLCEVHGMNRASAGGIRDAVRAPDAGASCRRRQHRRADYQLPYAKHIYSTAYPGQAACTEADGGSVRWRT